MADNLGKNAIALSLFPFPLPAARFLGRGLVWGGSPSGVSRFTWLLVSASGLASPSCLFPFGAARPLPFPLRRSCGCPRLPGSPEFLWSGCRGLRVLWGCPGLVSLSVGGFPFGSSSRRSWSRSLSGFPFVYLYNSVLIRYLSRVF